ncbi:MAG: hypothetical protein KDA75_15170, partial [Planctomycetaceae bacterium]|nr:hypothetical protein [Planctomycetaceae bacterium]
MNRRQLLSGIATACVSGWGASAKLFADEGTQTGLGLVTYCQSLRRKQRLTHPDAVDLFDPLTFLQHCRSLGAGGMQVAIGVLQSADAS